MDLKETLRQKLGRIQGRGYKAYKDIKGIYDFGFFHLEICHVQGDPFAAPSRFRVLVPLSASRFPESFTDDKIRSIALRDFLARQFFSNCHKHAKKYQGTGKSGLIIIDKPGQQILDLSAILIRQGIMEVRFFAGLPAYGRRIAADIAIEMIFENIPLIVEKSLFYENLDRELIKNHIETYEDSCFLRRQLQKKNLVAFVANGAILPRASGVDQRPLVACDSENPLVPFVSCPSLEISFELPNMGKLTGMGIPKGITLIVGGGFHGKSTLLNALELGIYGHVPGDGRELTVTCSNAKKIRSEDGRSIRKVCITPFISNLPFGKDTDLFSTDDASGSTSQAANIIEAMEADVELLLIDEDTSATNFMIRDTLMQKLIASENEPITPFIQKVQSLYHEEKISTILVVGGSGDYFGVSDLVIAMNEYKPLDLTLEAKDIFQKYSTSSISRQTTGFQVTASRIPVVTSLDPRRGFREIKISAQGLNTIVFGRNSIDLSGEEQLVHESQLRAIGFALHYSKRYIEKNMTIREIIKLVEQDINEKGFDILIKDQGCWEMAGFRMLEFAAALNRLRSLEIY